MEIPVKRILIPVGEYTDPTPLIKLVDIIQDLDKTEIILFGVVSIPFVTSIEQDEIRDTEPYKRIRDKLEEVKVFFNNIGLDPMTKLVISRDVPEAIIEESVSGEYDLIILIKRIKPPRFLGRSVSQSILSRLPKPLLILTMEE